MGNYLLNFIPQQGSFVLNHIFTPVSHQYLDMLISIEFGLAILVFFLLFFVPAPYGKHHRLGWGPHWKSSLAWVFMESPAVLVMAGIFVINLNQQSPVSLVFLIIWLSHYLYRTFIYPFSTNNPSNPFPVIIALFGFIFNCLNGTVNGQFLFHSGIEEDTSWLVSGPFIIGTAIFYLGMFINKQSELILSRLNRTSNGEYSIPTGGWFSHVSNPHYLGEIIEWLGWAILTWSLGGLAFFAFTCANLIPRAVTAHRWYKGHFEDYPTERKAIIPWIW